MFDLIFVSSPEEAEHERRLIKELKQNNPEVKTANYFRDNCRRVGRGPKRKRSDHIADGKPIVVFVPVMCVPWPQRPIELTQPFPMEYLRWHRALAEFMASRDDYYFVWKGLYLPNQNFEYMADYIVKRGFGNLSFHSGKLGEWLAVASKVICDSPSTAFFEAIFSGLPVLSLYRPNDQRLRQNAKEAYGDSLAPYSSIDEGLQRVEYFLNAHPREYVVTVPRSQTIPPSLMASAVMGSALERQKGDPHGSIYSGQG